MPFYDYRCPHCFNENEIQHSMKENPRIKCGICGYKKMEKMISMTNVNVKSGATIKSNQVKNEVKKIKDMHTELREDYGVHDVTLTRPDMTYKHIYEEIKGNGKEVRDTMIEKRKANASDIRKKNIERQKHFATIRDQRIKEVKERAAKTAFEKRAIKPIK